MLPRVLALPLVTLLLGGCAALEFSPSWGPGDAAPDAEQLYQEGLSLLSAPEAAQDYAGANRRFEQAAELGHTKAQYFLGMAYYTGRGVRQSYPRARRWLEMAAQQGHAYAQYHLGDIYLNGWGVTADPAWAAMWFGRAAQQGNAAAQFSLGVCYASGLGLPREPLRARAWLRLAARQGHPEAPALERKLATSAGGVPPPVTLGKDGWMTPPVVAYVQMALTALGHEPGPVDGVWGERTAAALARFLNWPGEAAEIATTPQMLDELRQAGGTLPSPFVDTLRRWFD